MQNWAEMTADQRSTIKTAYNAAGISLVVSAFGSTDQPATSGTDPTATAQSLATWVKANEVDGVDIGKSIGDLLKILDSKCNVTQTTRI